MKKKSYLIIIWIITLIAIVVGVCINVMGWFNPFIGKIVEDEYTFEGKNIDTIIIDADIADVTFLSGNSLEVVTNYPEKLAPTVSVEGYTINIQQKVGKWYNNVGSNKMEIKIIIPSDYTFVKVSTNTDVGDMDISNVNADAISITANVGDINASNISADNMTITSGVGDVKLQNINSTEAAFTLDVGDFELTSGTIKTVEVSTDTGDIDLTADFDELDAQSDVGDIDIHTDRDLDDVKIKAGNDVGDVYVNGEKW
ncbi:DUF4097 family beta strand repeat-containing protein [Pseudobutyrivibrio sp.]|uniref:DUF4097 family beta strand repeat-containing protein n=1 Tax=Pseudobutyrivibrio sp. TaxID=2014367 RepID=UPI001D7E0540|nr:DUF4097 family beta strand repeat-containing protein [Pseudobutyrivibrio sp.]MBE5912139.1 DUF4097 domain-containing protein [Pseudobutyrivibrio sp.]